MLCSAGVVLSPDEVRTEVSVTATGITNAAAATDGTGQR